MRRLLNPTVIGFIVVGYVLLTSIILFREEINLALGGLTPPALASETAPAPVAVSALPPVSVIEPPRATYQEYVQTILDDPANFKTAEPVLPGRAYLEGKQTQFLIGF